MSSPAAASASPGGHVLSRGWKAFLALSVVAGLVLRLIWAEDMEYKEDEEYNFTMSQAPGWPWVGMPSGVYVANPGMSVWAFKALAIVSRATHPTELARAVQLFALLGICLVIPFVLKVLKPVDDKRPWLWAMALALVNPFAILYQRKLWPEPLLPVFSMLMLAGWWRRDLRMAAFAWGFFGAWLGQIHMSGFFFAAGFPLATLLFRSAEIPLSRVRWGAWFVGSVLGSLPLIPWLQYSLEHPIAHTISRGWEEMIQLKFWVFWATDAIGLHLGNPLGINRGPTGWDQISDFVRYPLIGGRATYLCGLAHVTAAAAAAAILLPGAWHWLKGLTRLSWVRELRTPRPEVQLAMIAGLWLFGLLLTASSVMIRRYYLMVSFPLEFLWLARVALSARGEVAAQALRDEDGNPAVAQRAARRPFTFASFHSHFHPHPHPYLWLGVLWASQLFISACFVGYVHVNEGSPTGDYGDAYHVVMKKRGK
jgi:hypothetical protein